MFKIFEINEAGDAVFVAAVETHEDALAAVQMLENPRIEYDYGWGSSVIFQ